MSEAKVCFLDDNPASVILNGTPFCAVHAVCAWCGTPLIDQAFGCTCSKHGMGSHEESLWCSDAHREADHPDADPLFSTLNQDEDDESTPDHAG